jgi:hypothetical protein
MNEFRPYIEDEHTVGLLEDVFTSLARLGIIDDFQFFYAEDSHYNEEGFDWIYHFTQVEWEIEIWSGGEYWATTRGGIV